MKKSDTGNRIIKIIFPLLFILFFVFIIICIWREINIIAKLKVLLECIFLLTVIAIGLMELYEIITGGFCIKRAIIRATYILITYGLHVLIQPETLIDIKRKKPEYFQIEFPIEDFPIKHYDAFSVRLIVGKDINHSSSKINSEKGVVYANIQINGLKKGDVAYGEIDWGEFNSLEKIDFSNGANYQTHTYNSNGEKNIKCKVFLRRFNGN